MMPTRPSGRPATSPVDWSSRLLVVAASILEGLDEILSVISLALPAEIRRSLACTNISENMMGTVRRVCRNSLPL
jgi:hypothetical protein